MNTNVNLNLDRGSCRITTPLYLGAHTDVVFDIEGDYNLILTAPFADSPSEGVAVWAQSHEGRLSLNRQALVDAFIKADARQPNMTVTAKVFVSDTNGNVIADGEASIEYTPEYIIDPAEYPSAREILGKAENARTDAENAANSAKKDKDAAAAAKTSAEEARDSAQKAVIAAESAADIAGSKAGEAAASASIAVAAKYAAEKASDDAKEALAIGSSNITAAVSAERLRAEEAERRITEAAEKAQLTADKAVSDTVRAEAKVDTLIGSDANKPARTIAAEEVAKVVANAPQDLDTLKEIADYIASDKTDAAHMLMQIADNTKAIANESKRAQDAEASIVAMIKSLPQPEYHYALVETTTTWEASIPDNLFPIQYEMPSLNYTGEILDSSKVFYRDNPYNQDEIDAVVYDDHLQREIVFMSFFRNGGSQTAPGEAEIEMVYFNGLDYGGLEITDKPVMLTDRAINKVNIVNQLDGAKIEFPPAVEGYARDFIFIPAFPTGTVEPFFFQLPAGAVIYGDGFNVEIGAAETWMFTITEVSPNAFYVKSVQLEVA